MKSINDTDIFKFLMSSQNVISGDMQLEKINSFFNKTDWIDSGSEKYRFIPLDRDVIEKDIKNRSFLDYSLYLTFTKECSKYIELLKNDFNITIKNEIKDAGYVLISLETKEFQISEFRNFYKDIIIFLFLSDFTVSFSDENKKIVLKKGSSLVVPSNFMFEYNLIPQDERGYFFVSSFSV